MNDQTVVAHPLDEFDPDIGGEIVRGRIKRMLGEIRTPYDPIPNFILSV